MTNASQQIGGSLGTALLNTFYATAVTSYIGSHAKSPDLQAHALVHGYDVAFTWGAGIPVLCAVIAFAFIRTRGDELPGTTPCRPWPEDRGG